jgi:hypothetical protein
MKSKDLQIVLKQHNSNNKHDVWCLIWHRDGTNHEHIYGYEVALETVKNIIELANFDEK